VMESQTGKIVTMVNQDWAIRNSFKPCSTIKLVTGVAAISEHVINNDGDIVGDSSSVRLNTAIAYSKNPYFQRAGVKMGSSKMVDYAHKLGLGIKTGINAEGETPGRVPFNNNNPRIYSHGDDFEVTPLQLAVMVTALSNGGKKVVPQIQKTRVERTSFKPKYNGSIGLTEEKYQGVLPGMMGAAEYGTARRGVDPTLGIAGKTGSCIGKGSWVGLFASVAPVENPKYAVVVITRGEGERGKFAAGVAHRIYAALSPQITRDLGKYMAIKNRTAAGSQIDAQSAAVEDDEEDDDTDANTQLDTGRSVIPVAAQPQMPKKTVIKTADSRPVFSPVVIPYDKDQKSADPAVKQRPRIVKN
jgi:penicillin-binding protein 2